MSELVAAHGHVPLALTQGSAHVMCLGYSNVWQCIEARLSSPCLHTPSDISCPATSAGAGNFGGRQKELAAPLSSRCSSSQDHTKKGVLLYVARMVCKLRNLLAAALLFCHISPAPVQPCGLCLLISQAFPMT